VQRLSDPLFAGPFLAALGVAAAASLAAAFVRWRYGDAEREPHERVAYLAGQLGLVSFVPFGVALAFDYAETQARLSSVGGTEPSVLGAVGRALPWEAVLWVSVGTLVVSAVAGASALIFALARKHGPVR